MTLDDLTAYAREKYQITEQRKNELPPGFSVLCDPNTGLWAALLMRQWDSDAGETIELCDIRGGRKFVSELSFPYIAKPFRMKRNGWIGVRFDERTRPKVVQILFDYAMTLAQNQDHTIVLDSQSDPDASAFRETPLPRTGAAPAKKQSSIPDKIRKMRQLVQYGANAWLDERQKFYLQGKFMQDYEDDAPFDRCSMYYFPTYNNLMVRELRGYFTWRTAIRHGQFQPVNDSFANMYLCELLNQIGTDSPQDSLRKMREFETGFIDAGYGDEYLRKKLRRWMMEFSVLYGIHPEEARQYADPDMLARDGAMAVLRSPESHTDDEVYAALLLFAKEKLMFSSALLKRPEEGKKLFARAWKRGCATKGWNGKNLFTQCFGDMAPFPWRPLANAIYCERRKLDNIKYQLNACRIYVCKKGEWEVCSYETLYFDRDRFFAFVHETDRQLRAYLNTGRPLKEKPDEAWARPFVSAAIEEDRKEKEEAAKPKIVLNLDGLEQIRRDALATRDSLLTDEEKLEMAEAEEMSAPPEPEVSGAPAVRLDDIQKQILRALLAGEPAEGIIRENRLLPSVAADGINEAFFEEIGDSVVEENGGGLALVEDYAGDVRRLLGGT